MNITYLQNAAHSGPGNILEWAQIQKHDITGVLLFDGDALPSTFPDLLIVLGGVPAECEKWLSAEINYIKQAIDAGTRVLGLCLGSQLIVEAAGGALVPHKNAECGWWKVDFNEEGQRHPALNGLRDTEFFFFHRNTVVLPASMTLLAHNAGCQHQIFSLGDRVLGIQGHPEMSDSTIEYLIKNKSDYVEKGDFVHITDQCHLQKEKLNNARHFVWTVMDNLLRL